MIKLQTPVTDEKCKVGISYSDKILMLGSCFSDNIGQQLKDYGFDVCINPFGTLYNPVSIFNSLETISGDREFTESDCVQIGAGDERWCSFFHHTSFARASKDEFLSNANTALIAAKDFFAQADKIIITLGTSWCFRHITSNMIVSNCLKRPASEYTRERLSSAEVTDILEKIAGLCSSSGKKKQIIFTVSPIRHFKDGAHGNQISKSALLLGIDDFLVGTDIQADYFPSYEIMMDELRDYRFYAEDMCHPSPQTTSYIRERFLEWALPANERPTLEENIRRFKRESHRQL